jgi:hypothetical protein
MSSWGDWAAGQQPQQQQQQRQERCSGAQQPAYSAAPPAGQPQQQQQQQQQEYSWSTWGANPTQQQLDKMDGQQIAQTALDIHTDTTSTLERSLQVGSSTRRLCALLRAPCIHMHLGF